MANPTLPMHLSATNHDDHDAFVSGDKNMIAKFDGFFFIIGEKVRSSKEV